MSGTDQGMVASGPALATGDSVSEEDFERIRAIGDGTIEPEQVYAFRMVASGDGLDYYFTRMADSSLKNFVRDLKAGQSVLGSHDINTFSYGSSYDGSIQKADPLAANYEASFYRQYAGKESVATSKLVVGRYFIVRDITLNGQPTNDLVTAMKAGGVRKSSVSFTVGRYVCGLDGTDMFASWFGPYPDEDKGCNHFPGVDYKKAGVAYAWIEDGDLMESSLVYKNASPAAMLVRYAEALAEKGMIPTAQVSSVEERLSYGAGSQIRLPGRVRTVYPAARVEDPMSDDPQNPPVPDEPPEAIEPVEPTEPPPSPEAAARQALDEAIAEAMGGPVTPDTIRALRERAAIGDALWAAEVDRAVAARVSAQESDAFDPDKYRSFLLLTRDVGFVQSELRSYAERKATVFTPGRSVEPIEGQDGPAAGSEGGLLSGVTKKRTAARQG